jgi:hypothetical protein
VDWTNLQTITSDDDKRAIADRAIAGIETCDVFVLLAGQPRGSGKYVELGATYPISGSDQSRLVRWNGREVKPS